MSSPEPHLLVRAGGRSFAIPGPRILRIARLADAEEARVDLSAILGGEPAVAGPETSVVVVSAGSRRAVGLIVDEATDIEMFGRDELVAPPDFGPRVALPYLAALAPVVDTFVVVLDIDRLLGDWKADA